MKTRILTIVLLTASIAIYAQPSRRGESERNENGQKTRNSSNNQVERSRSSNNQPTREVRSRIRENDRNRNTDYQPTQSTRIRETDHNNNAVRGNVYTPTRDSHNDREYRETRVYTHFERDHHANMVELRHPGTRIEVVRYHPNYHLFSVEYRRNHFPYRIPYSTEVIWSLNLSHNFGLFYPEVHFGRYPIGYRIPSIPAYDADDYIGEVATIYGKIFDSYYSYENDELYLYYGDYYPNHDFSVVIPGQEARKFSRNPEQYFNEQHVSVTGYVTRYSEKPEILVRQASQINLY